MEMFLGSLTAGIVVGSCYTIFAIGLTIIFSIMRVVNFAHGEFYMFGALLSWIALEHIVDNWWLAVILSVIIGAGLGFIAERIFRPTYARGMMSQFMIALGLVIILQESATRISGGVPLRIVSIYTTVRQLGLIRITDERLLVLGMALVTLAAIFLFFQRTKTGKAMRAAAGNRLAAGMVGIKANRMSMFAFIGGIGLAIVAGALVAPLFSINPFIGARLTGVAFVITIIGGIGSVGGAAIAGYTVGIIENLFGAYVSAEWSFVVMFLLLILVLLFRPLGLFGKEVA